MRGANEKSSIEYYMKAYGKSKDKINWGKTRTGLNENRNRKNAYLVKAIFL